jgi:hypothetical protein
MKLLLGLVTFLVTIQISVAQQVELIVLGTLQDGGMPHIGCEEQAFNYC